MKYTKETKTISGSDILQTDEKRTWRCTIKSTSGDIVTIPFEVLSKLLADCSIEVSKYGSHYQAYNIVK